MELTKEEKLKHSLASNENWKMIKHFQLDKIVSMSAGVTEPLLIKGMLRTIFDIDSWIKNSEEK